MILILFLCLIRPSHEYNQIPIIDIPIDFNDTIESILQKVKDKRNNDQNVIDEESYFGNFSKEILLDFKEDEECPLIIPNITIEEELEEETNYSLIPLIPLVISFSISLFPCCCCLSCCCCCCCCSLCRLPERKKAKERENKRNYRATDVKINQDLADDLAVVTKDLLFNTTVNTYDGLDGLDDDDNYKEQETYL